MIINNALHIQLLQDELIFQTNVFEQLLETYVNTMRNDGRLYVGRYIGFDEARGNIIVKFDQETGLPPRKNEHFQCFLPTSIHDGRTDWGGKTYRHLRTNAITQFEGASVFVTYEKLATTVGISGVKQEDIEKYEKGALILLGPPDPPLRYISNLVSFLENAVPGQDSVLGIDTSHPSWNPQPMVPSDNFVTDLQILLAQKDIVIIQGPPGTGKTYLIAQLCSALLRTNLSIIVTTLTNRALIEVAEKEHLKEMLSAGKVFKTNVTADESRNKKLTGLRSFKSLSQQQPPLLLATYYAMSQLATAAVAWEHFDYVIIEEASQAFLSTIAMARKLGKKCIIIGDLQQLEPIFHKETNPADSRLFHYMVCGLKTVSYFLQDAWQFILTNTYRLTPRSAAATNSFYNGQLTSHSPLSLPMNFSGFPLLEQHLHAEGGPSLTLFELPDGRQCGVNCIEFIIHLIDAIKQYHTAAHVSVLAFHRDTIRFLQKEVYGRCTNINDVLVETIDRVQGLTTDFCILLMPVESIPFVLQVNRFNVATSRSRKCTLLVSDKSLLHFTGFSPEITAFFNQTAKNN